MTLPTDFTISRNRTQHLDDHKALHRSRNVCIYADDYDTIQDALDDATARKIPVVTLTPNKTYNLATTLNIPNNVTLDGGARGHSAIYGATLRATTPLSAMVEMGNYSSIIGTHLNLMDIALVGVRVAGNFQTVESCWIYNGTAEATGIKAGGALYPQIRNNLINAIGGYSLDALNEYSNNPANTYYGINHGISMNNMYGGRLGIRVEGMITSLNDDFENIVDGEASVTVGDSIQSQMTMIQPYFELKKGTASVVVAIKVKAPSLLFVSAGQIYGDLPNIDGSIAIQAQSAYGINVQGTRIARWEKGFSGMVANNASLMIAGNYFVGVTTPNALSNTQNADISLMHPAVS